MPDQKTDDDNRVKGPNAIGPMAKPVDRPEVRGEMQTDDMGHFRGLGTDVFRPLLPTIAEGAAGPLPVKVNPRRR